MDGGTVKEAWSGVVVLVMVGGGGGVIKEPFQKCLEAGVGKDKNCLWETGGTKGVYSNL